jgi:hypothetical protein
MCRVGIVLAGASTALVYVMLARGKRPHRICYYLLATMQTLKLLFEGIEHL